MASTYGTNDTAAPVVSSYRGRRCESVNIDGLRCMEERDHSSRRDRRGVPQAPVHRTVRTSGTVTWRDA